MSNNNQKDKDYDFNEILKKYSNNNHDRYNDAPATPVYDSEETSRLEAEYLENRRRRALESQGIDSFEAAPIERPPVKRNAPKRNKPKKSSGNKKLKATIIAIIAIICIIVAIIMGTIGSVLGKINYDEKVENQYVDSNELKSEKGIYNVLFLGVDARISKGEEAQNSRSDSMMIVSVDTKHNCIKTISFLRDTWVYIPCKDMHQRLNAACQYGSYNGVMDTIEYNFGIDIDGYVVVDFEVFKSLVDALGGVKIEVTKEEAKEVNSHKRRYGKVKLKEGKHTLNGKQTLAYCRIRKIDTDFQRAYRQRMVIKSIISGVKSQPTKAFSIANNCAEYIETNLTKSELEKIGFNTTKCITKDMLETRVPFDGTWQYANINGASVIKIDTEANKEMLIDYIYNKTYDEIASENAE